MECVAAVTAICAEAERVYDHTAQYDLIMKVMGNVKFSQVTPKEGSNQLLCWPKMSNRRVTALRAPGLVASLSALAKAFPGAELTQVKGQPQASQQASCKRRPPQGFGRRLTDGCVRTVASWRGWSLPWVPIS